MLKKIDDNSIDLIIIDPPYYNNLKSIKWDNQWKTLNDYINWLSDIFAILSEKIHKGFFFCFCDVRLSSYIIDIGEKNCFAYKNFIVWYKKNYYKFTPFDRLRNNWEGLLMFAKGKNKLNIWEQNNSEKLLYNDVWEFAQPQSNFKKDKKQHITQKPIKLIENIIQIASQENNNVLDCFAGVGTTLVACKKLNRKYIGIEIDSDFCKITKIRLKEIK
ncbi:MAG TPA: site-specific DNA-methyltransferase [bacterium]|nr:site-specific DNA-methyltransferase [bacterium]